MWLNLPVHASFLTRKWRGVTIRFFDEADADIAAPCPTLVYSRKPSAYAEFMKLGEMVKELLSCCGRFLGDTRLRSKVMVEIESQGPKVVRSDCNCGLD